MSTFCAPSKGALEIPGRRNPSASSSVKRPQPTICYPDDVKRSKLSQQDHHFIHSYSNSHSTHSYRNNNKDKDDLSIVTINNIIDPRIKSYDHIDCTKNNHCSSLSSVQINKLDSTLNKNVTNNRQELSSSSLQPSLLQRISSKQRSYITSQAITIIR
ncbi:hypothetical protein PCANC_02540 [Puccinia coronata f. sp. avenae]|uniref:Uncharacterized protein n=1 Tax=Puccinia coronata f. sp. avenae TaxID=200324 RepID=A0A2N5VYG2_9BASI|nr:hypothetical protein PCANC_02540 [Puccinia coronata f. sp. avenae]